MSGNDIEFGKFLGQRKEKGLGGGSVSFHVFTARSCGVKGNG